MPGKSGRPGQFRYERLREMPVAHRDRVETLAVHKPASTPGRALHPFNSVPEPDGLDDVGVHRESPQVLQHPAVVRIAGPTVVPATRAVERVAIEGHQVPRQVGLQRLVKGRVDSPARSLAERIVLHVVRVVPQSTDPVGLFEYGGLVPLEAKLVRRNKAGRTGTDHGDTH